MPHYEQVDLADVKLGDRITVLHLTGDLRGCGQGGTLKSVNSVVVVLAAPLGDHTYPTTSFTSGTLGIEIEVPLPLTDCIEFDPDLCNGAVDYFSVSGRGSAPPRCRHHTDKRIETYQNSIERYAHSATAPSWFDPTYAGESWEDDRACSSG